MRSIALGGIAAAVLLVAAGCASPGTAPTAPASPGSLADLPTPSPAGEVLAVATVLEQGDGAILCVGAVEESAPPRPPQCDGPELIGWDWDAFEHQETGGVRWVQGVAVTGDYDPAAATFTQTGDPMSVAAITLPAVEVPAGDADEATIQSVQEELMELGRADLFAAWGERGTVVLLAVYDDGTLQAAVDEVYGAGVVFVVSALRDAEPSPTAPPIDTAAPVITGDLQAQLAQLPRPSATEPVGVAGTALEAGSGPNAGVPMLCLNIAASYPPQCGGPEIIRWDWSAIDHETANGVRWTESAPVAMRVTYDAIQHAVTPVEMVDPASIDMVLPGPMPAGSLDTATIAELQEALIELSRPDILGFGDGNGSFSVDVVYDDGSIQAAFDDIYGPDAVHVWSWMG